MAESVEAGENLSDPDRFDANRLLPEVYDELRQLAAHYMRGERRGHTLQPTALVHEAYAKLVGLEVAWADRVQFFKAAAQAMRRILVDHARAHRSEKRGGGVPRASFTGALELPSEAPVDVLDLDRALEALEKLDPRKAQVVELHFFAGLGFEEIAGALDISPATVDRDMRFARAWLRARLEGAVDGS